MIEPTDIYIALALMLIFEGLVYGLFPEHMKKMVAQILAMPAKTIQNFGLGAAFLGCILLYII